MTLLKSTFEEMTSIKNLARATRKAMKGKRNNLDATRFSYNFMSRITRLQTELQHNIYRPSSYRDRIIYEPKKRHIQIPSFRDRVVHHAIHNILSPFYERHFIKDSYACRKDKGSHHAIKRVQFFLKNARQPLYVCKLDVSKYYPSINHQRLKDILAKRIKEPRIMNLLGIIIDSTNNDNEYTDLFAKDSYYHTKGHHGVPIGNLTSQLFGNIYLHEVDMYAKQKLKIRRYIRYMDDILIFHEDKEQLKRWQTQLTDFLYEELYLTINPRKVRLYPARIGVEFVGYVIFNNYIILRGSSVRRHRHKQRKQIEQMLHHKLSRERLVESFIAWEAHANHANAHQLVDRLWAEVDEALDIEQKIAEHFLVQLTLFDLNDFLSYRFVQPPHILPTASISEVIKNKE